MRHDLRTAPKSEHGTTTSYVVGFILSLVFTIIPYYLVVGHVVSGSLLLATILGFAVMQMIIQIVFFLHLGRQKSPNWQFVFFISTVGIILVVIGGSLWIMYNLHANMALVAPADASKKLINDEAIAQIGGQKTGACEALGANHQIMVEDDRITPVHTTAHRCDTLTFITGDGKTHHIMFGTLDDPKDYAGEDLLLIRKGRNKTITLTETGAWQFHNHLHPETTGRFSVEQ